MEGKLGLSAFLVLLLAWEAYAAVNCTETGAGRFAEPTDTTCQNYTLCVFIAANNSYVSYNYVCPSTSLFSPTTSQCTTNYVCNVTDTSDSVCTADGYVADPSVTNCSSYIECVDINGTFTETTYTCPDGTFYNPNTTLCDSDYVCNSTSEFTCTAAGRFANTNDDTCQTYFLCVVDDTGAITQYNYTCPTTSVFSPTARVCTTTYTCPTAE